MCGSIWKQTLPLNLTTTRNNHVQVISVTTLGGPNGIGGFFPTGFNVSAQNLPLVEPVKRIAAITMSKASHLLHIKIQPCRGSTANVCSCSHATYRLPHYDVVRPTAKQCTTMHVGTKQREGANHNQALRFRDVVSSTDVTSP